MKIRIYYEDTDAAGIVYYANYLKFCERARSELFFQKGLSPQTESGYFVVKHIEADYLFPASLGDLVEVQTVLVEKRGASILLRQSVFKGSRELFRMMVKLVFVRDGKPVKIPLSIQSLLSSWKSERNG